MPRNLAATAVAPLAVGLVACGGEAQIEPSASRGETTGNAREPPEPAFAWALDGDGAAEVGNVDLEFSGSHSLNDESVAFDGVTGSSASSSAPDRRA